MRSTTKETISGSAPCGGFHSPQMLACLGHIWASCTVAYVNQMCQPVRTLAELQPTELYPSSTNQSPLAFSVCGLCGCCLPFGVQQFRNCPPTFRQATGVPEPPRLPQSRHFLMSTNSVRSAPMAELAGPDRLIICQDKDRLKYWGA